MYTAPQLRRFPTLARELHCLAVLLLLACVPASHLAADDGEGTLEVANLELATTTLSANGGGSFQMHRLLKVEDDGEEEDDDGHKVKGVVLLLPPLANGFDFFLTDERGGFNRSFGAYLAHRGYDVWGYSPRTGDADGWGIADIVDDVAQIREQIRDAYATEDEDDEEVLPIIGGYSLGAMAAAAVVDSAPSDWGGALLLEGSLYSADDAVRERNEAYCADLQATLSAGSVYDTTTFPAVKLIADAAETDPNGETPLEGFPPGTTNHQVFVAALSLPGDGPNFPTETFVRLRGDFETDRFAYAFERRVFEFTSILLDEVPLRVLADISCALAGDESFVDDLGDFEGPVYLLAAGHGFGPVMADLASLFTGSEDITIRSFTEYGHADNWFTASHRADLEAPILHWLRGNRHPQGGPQGKPEKPGRLDHPHGKPTGKPPKPPGKPPEPPGKPPKPPKPPRPGKALF